MFELSILTMFQMGLYFKKGAFLGVTNKKEASVGVGSKV